MLKRILAVITGLLVGFAVIMIIEGICGKIYPPPPGTDLRNPESVKAMMAAMPSGALMLVLLSYLLGCITAGITATLISGKSTYIPAVIVGTLFFCGGISNILTMPGHPMWFIILSQLVYIPAAYLGYFLVREKKS